MARKDKASKNTKRAASQTLKERRQAKRDKKAAKAREPMRTPGQ